MRLAAANRTLSTAKFMITAIWVWAPRPGQAGDATGLGR